MFRLYFIIHCLLASINSFSQSKIDPPNEVKEKAVLKNFDSFFKLWVNNKRIQKIDLNSHELFKDSLFTYFRQSQPKLFSNKPTYYKVYTDSLDSLMPNYRDFYGSDLSSFIWNEVIPKADVILWQSYTTSSPNHTRPKCPRRRNSYKQTYSLIDRKVVLSIKWEIDCDNLNILKDKEYKAYYNLLSNKLEKPLYP